MRARAHVLPLLVAASLLALALAPAGCSGAADELDAALERAMHASPSPSHALARVLSVWRRATAAADTSATSARALLAHALLLLDHSDTADAPRVADTLQRALVASGNAVRAHAASADEHAVLSIVAALVLHASASPRDAVAHDDAHAHDDDAWSLRRAVLAEAVMATQQHVSAAAAQALVTLLDALTVAAHADDAHALALARERAALHRALGTALAYANRLAEAQEALARALQHTPHDGDLLIDMGAILQLQGHARDAVQYFARAATLGASMGYMLAARALDDAGLLAEALPYYLRARTVAIEVDEFRAAGHAVERALDELSVRAVDAALARLEARIASAPDAGGGAGVSSGGADAPAAAAAAAADAPATTTGVVAVDVHADEATQHAQLHHNAMKLSDAARYDDALAVFDELLARIGPLSAADGSKRTDAAPFINRALTLSRAGRSNEAAPLLREVVRVEPQNGVAWFNLANALMDTGVWHEARDAYERAAALLPDNPTAASSLARWYMAQNRNVEAAQLFREAVQRHPDYHGHWVNLGITLKELSYLEDAREAFERAVALAPDDAVTWYNLGSVYKDAQRFAESRHAYAQALRLRGHDFAEAFTEMVHSMFWVCDWTDYASNMRTFARLLATSDETRVARLVQPFYTLITPVRLGIVLKASRAYAERTYRQCAGAMPGAPGPAAVPPAHALFAHGRGARASARVVRVGFMSSDLRTHAVGRQLSTLFEYLVADNGPAAGLVDAVAFHTQPTDDSVWAKRIDAALGPARQRTIDETASVTDAARTIARERVDILLNLNGHTKGARSDVLSLRAVAPLQVAYLGYPSTVGAFHDYLLSDRVSSPPSLAVLGYSEHLVYMPHTYQVTEHAESFALDHGADLDADAERRRAARADAGLPEHGIVFTSFNQLFRIDPRTYDVWCRLLLRVPGSVLWLVRMPDEAADNLVLEATRRGVDAGRVVFAKMVNKAEHMRRLRLADVMLDSPVYNGHTTCGDALWAGVPVVTLLGRKMPARVAAAMLHALGVTETIAHSMDEYEGIALRLAQDAGERAALRARILQQRGVAPLFDNARYSADLVRAFALMVETRAAAGQPACAWAPDEMASREACYRRLGRHIVLRGGRAAMTRAVQ